MESTTLDDAFFEGDTIIENITLRPMSLMTGRACRKLGLSIFLRSPEEAAKADPISEDEISRQLVAFAWAQSEPVSLVRRALDDGSALDLAADFEAQLHPSVIAQLTEQLFKISKRISAAQIEIVPRPGSAEEGAPGKS